MAEEKKAGVDRRAFLKSAAAGAGATAATVLAQVPAGSKEESPQRDVDKKKNKKPPGDIVIDRPGSDFMIDVIKTLDLEYMSTNPGSSFRSIHESLINYGGNTKPELLTCMHEEAAIAMAHGYAKAAGKPMGAMIHGTVGLQHGSMAIYNAWVDRVPIVLFAGNGLDAMSRRPGTEWNHSVQDAAGLVRDFVKWDDTPVSLQHFAESTVRAYKIATTPPTEPVLITCDIDLQEHPVHDEDLRIPKLARSRPPQGDRRRPRSGWWAPSIP
jgi:thiamine pyrophosphate-dependent acetolactate synthase large subunit-like protein